MRTLRRDGTIDLLRLVSAFAIVDFHIPSDHREFSLAALPIFVALLVFFGVKNPSPKRLWRLIEPWLFWSAVFLILRLVKSVSLSEPLTGVFQVWMLVTGGSLHLWFLSFGALFLALVWALPERARMLFLVLTSLLAIWAMQLDGLPVPIPQWASVWPAAAMGYFMAKSQRPWRVCAVAGGFFLLQMQSPFPDAAMQNGIAATVLTVALLVPTEGTAFTEAAGKLALGIYLVHPIFISVVELATDLSGLSKVAAVCALSLAATMLLRPFLAPRFI